MMRIKYIYYKVRRYLLKKIIPEFVWPKYVTLDKVKFSVRNAPYSFGTKLALVKGEYENNERKLLADIIKKDDVIIEMGGSIGVLTSMIASKIENNGYIVSVEASDELANYSKKVLSQKNVHIINGFGFPVMNLSNNLEIKSFSTVSGSMGGKVEYFYNNESNKTALDKNIYSISRIMDLFHLKPTILLIDIEGSETILLLEKPNFPKTVRSIIIEFHPSLYGRNKMNKIINIIKAEGFDISNKSGNVYNFEKKIEDTANN